MKMNNETILKILQATLMKYNIAMKCIEEIAQENLKSVGSLEVAEIIKDTLDKIKDVNDNIFESEEW